MTMPDPVLHTEFTIERHLRARPARAFRFWSDKDLKARWNDCHTDWTVLEDSLDFRVGGEERKHWRMPDQRELTFRAHYLDILPDARIIYAYEMTFGGTRLSASLVTVTLQAAGDGTRMTFVEQAALLQGGNEARDQRIVGTGDGFDRLESLIATDTVPG